MFHIHWHVYDHKAGVNNYFECRCGSRKVRKPPQGNGASPVNTDWLEHKR